MAGQDKYSIKDKLPNIFDPLSGAIRGDKEIRDSQQNVVASIRDKKPHVVEELLDANSADKEIRDANGKVVATVCDVTPNLTHALLDEKRDKKIIRNANDELIATVRDKTPNLFESFVGVSQHQKEIRNKSGKVVANIRDKTPNLFEALTGAHRLVQEVRPRIRFSQKPLSPGGSSGGGDSGLGDTLSLGLLWLVIGPLYAMFLVAKGIVLALERRSFDPLIENLVGAAASIAVFCTIWGLLWAVLLWLARDIGGAHEAASQAAFFNRLFWTLAISSWAVVAAGCWVIHKTPQRAPQGTGASSEISPKGHVAGWLVGIGFFWLAPTVVAPTILALFPRAATAPLNPLMGIPILFLFPFGPAILLGRAVARKMSGVSVRPGRGGGLADSGTVPKLLFLAFFGVLAIFATWFLTEQDGRETKPLSRNVVPLTAEFALGHSPNSSPAGDPRRIPPAIRKILDVRYAGWFFPDVADEDRRTCRQPVPDFLPGLVYGDFDGDGFTDYGLAIQRGTKRYTLVFIARGKDFTSFAVEPSGWSILGVARKGTTVPRFGHGEILLKNDALIGMKCESSSVAYLYKDGEFTHFFMSD